MCSCSSSSRGKITLPRKQQEEKPVTSDQAKQLITQVCLLSCQKLYYDYCYYCYCYYQYVSALHDCTVDTHAHLTSEHIDGESSQQGLQPIQHADLLPIPKHTPEIIHGGQAGRHGLYALQSKRTSHWVLCLRFTLRLLL